MTVVQQLEKAQADFAALKQDRDALAAAAEACKADLLRVQDAVAQSAKSMESLKTDHATVLSELQKQLAVVTAEKEACQKELAAAKAKLALAPFADVQPGSDKPAKDGGAAPEAAKSLVQRMSELPTMQAQGEFYARNRTAVDSELAAMKAGK